MNWKHTPIILPLFIASFVAIYVLVYTWRRRNMRGARPLLPLTFGILIWLVASTIEGMLIDEAARLLWINIQYIGIVIVPTAWLIFSLSFTGRRDLLSRRNIALLLLMPLLTLAMVWTNAWHHFFRISLELDTSGVYPIWIWNPGPGFWLHTLYSYILLFCGFVILVQAYRQSSRLFRRQIIVILLGAAVPWLANIVFIIFPATPVDYTPIAFLISGLAIAWGIFKVGLVEVQPIIHKQVIDEMQDGVLILDEKNRILEANTAVLNVLGVTDTIIGQPIAKALARWPELITELHGAAFTQAELSLPLDNQEIHHYQISITPLHDKKGLKTGQLIMAHEITHLKEIETSLMEAAEAAEAASRAKSTFLATMSHELRTPLTAIIGYSELIEEKSEMLGYEKIVPQLRQIGIAAHSLNYIIGNILDLSKIEAERMELSFGEFPVAELIAEVVNSVQPQIEQNSNVLSVNLPEKIGVLNSDKAKLRQILLNLLGNAAKFTRSGKIDLSVSRDNESGYFEFTVSDNGEGIPDKIKTTLFEPFVQADASFTRVHGGSGLGLAISQRFCHMLGGSIAVESALGQGATFVVKMPIQLPEDAIVKVDSAVLRRQQT